MYEIRGIVKEIGEVKTHKNDFKTREMIVTRTKKLGKESDADRIVTDHKLKFTQDRTNYLDKVVIGEDVKIGFDLSSNWWKNPKTGLDVLIQGLVGYSMQSYGKPVNTRITEKEESVPEQKEDDGLPF